MEETSSPTRRNVFRNKNFTLVFLGALVSNIAALFYSFAVSFYILKISDNNALLQGLYLAVGGAVFCVASLYGGVISDRFNKVKIIYICDYLKGGIILGFTLLLMFVIESNEWKIACLFIITVLLNIIAGIFSPASNALLPEIVEEQSFQQAQSYFSILNSFQSIVGVFLAGILYTLIPINILFLIVGVCYIASAISEMFIRYNYQKDENAEKLTMKTIFSDIKSGFVYFATVKPMFILIICVLVFNFFFTPIISNFIPYFIVSDVADSPYLFHEIMAPEMWSSILSVGIGIGSLIMGTILSIQKQKEHYSRMVRFSFVLVSLLFVGFTVGYYLFTIGTFDINAILVSLLIGAFMTGILIVSINVPSSTAMMKMIEREKYGKVSSVINIGSQGLIPLATFLAGLSLTYIGSLGLLIICAAGLLITSIVIFLSKSIKKI